MANGIGGKESGLLYARLYQGVTLGNVWLPQFCMLKKMTTTLNTHKK